MPKLKKETTMPKLKMEKMKPKLKMEKMKPNTLIKFIGKGCRDMPFTEGTKFIYNGPLANDNAGEYFSISGVFPGVSGTFVYHKSDLVDFAEVEWFQR